MIQPDILPPNVLAHPAQPQPGAIFVVEPRCLGIGRDMMVGGPSGGAVKVIDLSRLDHAVTVDWAGPGCGSITDGADSIVFQGIAQIILPRCMHRPAMPAGAA